jgi:hypothetical protein
VQHQVVAFAVLDDRHLADLVVTDVHVSLFIPHDAKPNRSATQRPLKRMGIPTTSRLLIVQIVTSTINAAEVVHQVQPPSHLTGNAYI